MKLYYFMLIAVGLMYVFYLGGIDTGSGKILASLDVVVDSNSNNTVNLDPSIDAEGLEASNIKSNSKYIWGALIMFLILVMVFSALSSFQVGSSGVVFNFEGFVAGIAAFLWAIFSLDFYSILTKMYQVTGGIGWEFHLTWILIVPFLVGFALSIIQFVKGTE